MLLWSTLYNITHEKKWDFCGPLLVQNLNSSRLVKFKANTGSPTFGRYGSIALIRDPKARMVFGWKSKATYSGGNVGEARVLVLGLLKLAAVSKTTYRLGLMNTKKKSLAWTYPRSLTLFT